MCMFKNICIVGAGNIGSRHLQALSKITQPLLIQVIDPSLDSLTIAKQRYKEVEIHSKHQIEYLQNLDTINLQIDVAIIATNSNLRFLVTKQLLDKSNVKYIIFEKILFDKKIQYEKMANLLNKRMCKAWVNCSMRTDPFYTNLKGYFKNQKVTYIVSGSLHGLITNSIHYIDHISFLTDCIDFKIDTSHLESTLVESKRRGFFELMGTLNVSFNDGSLACFTCYPSGDSPFLIEILSEKYRILIDIFSNEQFFSSPSTNWKWISKKTNLLFQSQMTNKVVSSLLKTGTCDLTPLEISTKMHINLFEPLLRFVNDNSNSNFDSYPFT